jgi:2-dehydropantoate 2-reductase
MNVCVFGAGAVGGYVAARLLDSRQARVSVVARGAQLQAIRQSGLLLRERGKDDLAMAVEHATHDPATLPAQDVVIVTLKSTSLSDCAAAIAALLAPGGVCVFVTNGIPWWWQAGKEVPGGSVVDPDGLLWRHIGPQRVIGCVAVSSNVVEAPGTVRHNRGNDWYLGEPTGVVSDRLEQVTELFRQAGLNAHACADIREEIWRKLLINVPNHALASLTRQTTDKVYGDEALGSIAVRLVDEVIAIARADGHLIGHPDGQAVVTGNRPTVSGSKPSMFQDVLALRPLEVEAIFGEVVRIAADKGVAVPTLNLILPLLRGLNRSIVDTPAA